MRKVIRRDLRTILGSRVMAVVTFLLLQLALLPAVFMKKESFITTTLKCMIFATIILVIYFLYEGANLYLRNLQKITYFPRLREDGVPAWKVLVYKQVITLATIFAVVVTFVAGFAIDTWLIAGRYPVVKKELRQMDLSGLLGDTSGGLALPIVLAILNLLLVLAVMAALAYLSVSLTYVYVTGQKFAGLSCIFVFLTFYMFLMMMDSHTLGKLTSLGGRAAALVVYAAVLAAMYLGHKWFFDKKMLARCYHN